MKVQALNSIIPVQVLAEINVLVEKFKLNSGLRLSHFLAQCAHESGNFKVLNENLNYS